MVYLTKLATRFQRLVSFALIASHGSDNEFDAKPALRLSPAVMSRMKAFSDDMVTYGQTHSFLPPESNDLTGAWPDDHESTNLGIETEAKSVDVRKECDIADLQEILHPQVNQPLPRGKITKWLRKVFESNRGLELGTFNASILATIMKKQSSKWIDISMGFVSDVVVMVHMFITVAVASVCPDKQICRALVDTLFEDLVQRYQKAIDNTKFLLEVESSNTPMTLNHYFNDNLQKR